MACKEWGFGCRDQPREVRADCSEGVGSDQPVEEEEEESVRCSKPTRLGRLTSNWSHRS